MNLIAIVLASFGFFILFGTGTSRTSGTSSKFSARNLFETVNGFRYRRKVPELFGPQPKAPSSNDVLIIGSGFGGSISAFRLAQKKIRVTMLERGQRWPNDPHREIFAFEPTRDGRGLWNKTSMRISIPARDAPILPVDRFGGVLDITEYPNIEVWRGACVGGGSMVYTGVSLQPRERYFRELFGKLVSYKEMNNTYYPRVRKMLRVSSVPRDIYNSDPFGKSRVWDEQVRRAGYSIKRPPSVFKWRVVRDELRGNVRKSATIGLSNMGNSNGAKFDMTQNYLRYAEKTGYAAVYANHQVRDIEKKNGQFIVYVNHLSPAGKIVDTSRLTAKRVILAAGSIGSTELLVKAKAKGLIKGLNNQIGKGWGSNGDTALVTSFNEIRGRTQGAPCTSMIHDDSGPAPTTLEAWYLPVPIDIGLQGTLAITYDKVNRGHFTYNRKTGKVTLNWGRNASRLADVTSKMILDKILKANPTVRAGAPLLGPSGWTGFTAHPLGGLVLGKATDYIGQVRGVKGLYVLDGAAIPGSTGAVNPSLTISALAERNIERIIKRDFQ